MLPFRGAPHDDLSAADHVGVKGVEGLSELEEYVVGDIDDVVDGVVAYRDELFLEPLGGRADLDAADGDAGIQGGAGAVEDLDGDGLTLAGDFLRGFGLHQFAGNVEVAGDSPVGGRVHAVRRDLVFYDGLGPEVEEFLCGSARDGVFRKDHDPVMGRSDAELVLGADHAEGLDAAYL